jgi:hypothetical protein
MSGFGRWLAQTRIGRIVFRGLIILVVLAAAYGVISEEVDRQTNSITKRIKVIEDVSPYDVVSACLRSASCRRLLEDPDRVAVRRGGGALQPDQGRQPSGPRTGGDEENEGVGGSGGGEARPPRDDQTSPSVPDPGDPGPSRTGSPAGPEAPETSRPPVKGVTEQTVDDVANAIDQVTGEGAGEEVGAAVDETLCRTSPLLCTK